MRFAVLGSGSEGNAVLVEAGGSRVLVDAGFSARELVRRLGVLEVEPESLDGILLTHEHGDHIRGLTVFDKRFPGIPVLATPLTRRVVAGKSPALAWRSIERGSRFRLGAFKIDCFAVTHDAVEPSGFVFHYAGIDAPPRAFGLLTDAGYPGEAVLERLRGVGAAVIEANYDEEMLEADLKRPWAVKQRISGRHGHLSNVQAGELIAELCNHGLRVAVMAHLSRDCNEPARALQVVRRRLSGSTRAPLRLHCACQHEPSGWIEVPGGEPRSDLGKDGQRVETGAA